MQALCSCTCVQLCTCSNVAIVQKLDVKTLTNENHLKFWQAKLWQIDHRFLRRDNKREKFSREIAGYSSNFCTIFIYCSLENSSLNTFYVKTVRDKIFRLQCSQHFFKQQIIFITEILLLYIYLLYNLYTLYLVT